MPSEDVKGSIGIVIDQGKQEDPMSLAALMVPVDVEHDSEQRVELAIGLADRFQTALIGVAGLRAVAGLYGWRCRAEQIQPIRLSKGDGTFRAAGQEVPRPGPLAAADRMAQRP